MEVAFVAVAAATTLGAAISGAAFARRRRREPQLGLPAIQDGGAKRRRREPQLGLPAIQEQSHAQEDRARLPSPDAFAGDDQGLQARVRALRDDMRATEAAEAHLRSAEAKHCYVSRQLKEMQEESLVCRRALRSSLHALRVSSLESRQEVERHAAVLGLLGERLGIESSVLSMLPVAASTKPSDRNIFHTHVFICLEQRLAHAVSSLESMLPQVSAEVEASSAALACARRGADVARAWQRANYEAFQAAHGERRACVGAGLQRGSHGAQARRTLTDGVPPVHVELLAGSGDFRSTELVGNTATAPPVVQGDVQCRGRDDGQLSEHGASPGQFSCFWEDRGEHGGDSSYAQGAASADDANGADEEWTDALALALERDSGTISSEADGAGEAGAGERILLALLNHGGDREMAEIKGLAATDIAKVKAYREQQGHLKRLEELAHVLGRRVTAGELLRENELPLQ